MLIKKTFKSTPTIIFLNKKDVLKQKIRDGGDPTVHFPELKEFIEKKSSKSGVTVSFQGMPADEEEVDIRYFSYITHCCNPEIKIRKSL